MYILPISDKKKPKNLYAECPKFRCSKCFLEGFPRKRVTLTDGNQWMKKPFLLYNGAFLYKEIAYTYIITSTMWLLIVNSKVKNLWLCMQEYWDTSLCSDVQQTYHLLSSTLSLSLDFWPFIWHCPVISLVLQILASHLTSQLWPFTWPVIS